MKLCNIFKYPWECLDYMERYVNDGSPSGFTWENTTSKDTAPRSRVDRFNLLEGIALNGKVESYGKIPIKLHHNSILLHPDMKSNEKIYNNVELKPSLYFGIPTSSARTVRIVSNENENIYAKLHYDGIIGRVNRKITRKHALSGLETTFLLYDAINSLQLPYFFTFLPESGCKVISFEVDNLIYEFGTVFREALPYGCSQKNIKIIIPLFSLLSKDRFYPDDEILIEQIVKQCGDNPYKYVMEKIIKPVLQCYFTLIITLGLQPEWHGQNILLGFSDSLSQVYVIARDLDSVDKDITIMKKLGMDINFASYPYKCLDEFQYNYTIKHSFMFDHKVGEYIIEPLLNYLINNYGLNSFELVEEIKCFVDPYLKKLPQNFFPCDKCWYKFDNVIVNQDINYRPYVKLKNPKYRRID